MIETFELAKFRALIYNLNDIHLTLKNITFVKTINNSHNIISITMSDNFNNCNEIIVPIISAEKDYLTVLEYYENFKQTNFI